ncbi:MAG: ABC transporter permease [Alphaproteobacteria bacterium]
MANSDSAFKLAFDLLSSGDAGLWQVVGLSVYVSGLATLLAMVLGGTIAGFLAVSRFPGKRIVLTLFRTMTGLPAVVVGLIVYLLLSRSGPLGVFGLLFTPGAMVIAQTVLLTPLVVALSHDILDQRWRIIGDLLRAYKFGPLQCLLTLAIESRVLLTTVALAAFGRAIAEVGAVMIVGGNIEGYTRVMTTAIALETTRGNLPLALGLGLILLLIALLVNVASSLATANSMGSR